MKDKNGVEIKLGQRVRTNEAGWIGKVVKFGDVFLPDPLVGSESWVLVDQQGGYSLEPDWAQTEVLDEK